jgi:putative heme iron utilization protein
MKSLSKLHQEAITKAKTENDKVKAAAVAMIERPMEMIEAILLKHEQAVIEVMRELQEAKDAAVMAERQRIVNLLMIQHEATKGAHNYWHVAAQLIQADVASDT